VVVLPTPHIFAFGKQRGNREDIMIDLHKIIATAGLDPASPDPQDLKSIIEELEKEVRDLVSGAFYFSEVISLIETLVQIYAKYGTMPRDQIADTVEIVFKVLDETYHIVDYIDSLVPADRIPVVGGIIEQFDDSIIRWVLFSLVVPAAVRLIDSEN
jgi:hypothetical protein